MRMPCVMRWPARIAAGQVCEQLTTTMDVLPTLAALAGTAPPPERPIDGHDLAPILFEGAQASPYDEESFLYYFMGQLQAVRAGAWKLYLPLEARLLGPSRKTAPVEMELYNLREDIGEENEVSAGHPEVVERLLALAERGREELGDLDRPGHGQRPAGWVEHPTARVKQ